MRLKPIIIANNDSNKYYLFRKTTRKYSKQPRSFHNFFYLAASSPHPLIRECFHRTVYSRHKNAFVFFFYTHNNLIICTFNGFYYKTVCVQIMRDTVRILYKIIEIIFRDRILSIKKKKITFLYAESYFLLFLRTYFI